MQVLLPLLVLHELLHPLRGYLPNVLDLRAAVIAHLDILIVHRFVILVTGNGVLKSLALDHLLNDLELNEKVLVLLAFPGDLRR